MYKTRTNELPKNSTIYTPPQLSNYLFNLLKDKINKKHYILDPCCGKGSLLIPWKNNDYENLGIDNDESLVLGEEVNWPLDFFSLTRQDDWPPKVLILCNPSFNGAKPQLAPELWLDKILELFGQDVPIVFFAPIRLRLCSSFQGKRYQKWLNQAYPPISSIISMPTRDTFAGIDFFAEILIFNIPNLQPHYFYHHD